MKKVLMIICCIALLPTMVKANCYQINDNDLKNNCLAMEKDKFHTVIKLKIVTIKIIVWQN